MKIYHNPRCSKSRETLKIIEDRQIPVEIIEYLKIPLSESEIKQLFELLNVPLETFVRTKEAVFTEKGLDLQTPAQIFKAIAENPVLLERPIVVQGDKAIIGRPPENVLLLL